MEGPSRWRCSITHPLARCVSACSSVIYLFAALPADSPALAGYRRLELHFRWQRGNALCSAAHGQLDGDKTDGFFVFSQPYDSRRPGRRNENGSSPMDMTSSRLLTWLASVSAKRFGGTCGCSALGRLLLLASHICTPASRHQRHEQFALVSCALVELSDSCQHSSISLGFFAVLSLLYVSPCFLSSVGS